MRWIWDPDKSRGNRLAHGLGFETARLVFDDPLATSRLDSHAHELRWHTIGMIGNVVMPVVHTWPEPDPETGASMGPLQSQICLTPL